MPNVQSWEVSDELWAKVEPLLPKRNPRAGSRRKYQRRPGGGRKPMASRNIFSGIVYVLRTGCQWKALPKTFGSASAIHTHFQAWRQAGFFLRLWQAGLAEYDEMEGIAWEWQSLDGTQGKAPLAQDAVGNNPTDREKKRHQTQFARRRAWRPALPYRRRGQSARREAAGGDTGRGGRGTAQAHGAETAAPVRG
jgi:transposase